MKTRLSPPVPRKIRTTPYFTTASPANRTAGNWRGPERSGGKRIELIELVGFIEFIGLVELIEFIELARLMELIGSGLRSIEGMAHGSRRTAQDNRVLSAGYSSLVTCYWSLNAGYGIRVARYGIRGAGCGLRDACCGFRDKLGRWEGEKVRNEEVRG